MNKLYDELEKCLPEDCKVAIDSGEADVIFKYNNFVILDKGEAALFNCLPLIMTKYGFCIAIPYNGKTSYTSFGEIVCRTRGVVRFKNNFKCDYRRCNLEVTPWPTSMKAKK